MKNKLKGFKIALNVSKTLLLLFFLLLHVYFCAAQDDNDVTGKNLEAVRTAFITNHLKLSPEEAQKFWPVYNNYFQEVKSARKNHPNDVVAQQEAIVNIRKKYKPEFKNILGSDDRINHTYTVEGEFRNMLRDEWGKRHPNQQMAQPMKKN